MAERKGRGDTSVNELLRMQREARQSHYAQGNGSREMQDPLIATKIIELLLAFVDNFARKQHCTIGTLDWGVRQSGAKSGTAKKSHTLQGRPGRRNVLKRDSVGR